MARSGRYQEALDTLNESIGLAQTAGDRLAVVIALRNIAEIYRLQGNTTEALSYSRRAEDLDREIAGKPETFEANPRITEARSPIDRGEEISKIERESRIQQAIDRVRERVQARQKQQEPSEITEDPTYKNYLEDVKRSIVQAWTYPTVAVEQPEEGTVGVQFTIFSDGQVANVRVFQPSQRLPMNLEAMRAIKSAAPFAPIPKELGLEKIHIEFRFNYVLQASP